jgi:hypothetical protein
VDAIWDALCNQCAATKDKSQVKALVMVRREDIAAVFGAPAQSGKLPRTLTAGNGAKAALIGEFHEEFTFMDEEGEECVAKVPVSWDTIKRIWVAAVEHFDLTPQVTSTQPLPAAQCEHGNHLETCTICLMWRSLPSKDCESGK